jgi:pyridoxamine 5'-phosphate oxidase-like protein
MTSPATTTATSAAVSWGELEAAAPAIAEAGRRLLYARGDGEAILATIRGDGLPRIHPVNIGLVDGHLYTFVIGGSPKRVDLERDGRYAIHSHQDPGAPSEVLLRGHARRVDDAAERERAAAGWPFGVDESYVLFELTIAAALLGDRPTADDWPPRYTAWPGRAD